MESGHRKEDMRLLVLWLTGRCNLKCKYCYAKDGPAEDMDMATAVKALSLMGDAPFKLQFAGGEPLMKVPLMAEILDYADKNRLQAVCAVQTNGTLIDDRAAGLLKQNHVAVGVSLDGKPGLNERMRGETKKAVEGIRLLGEYGMTVNLNAVVTAENASHLEELADMAVYLGNVRGIGLDPLRYAGRARDIRVARASEDDLRAGLLRLKERLDMVNRCLPQPIVVREFEKAKYYLETEHPCTDYCYASQGKSFVVLPDGECYPCGSLIGEKQYYMGNVHSSVRPLQIHGIRPEKCFSCRYRSVCTGGCPSRSLLMGGFDELDCLIKRISFQFAEKNGE